MKGNLNMYMLAFKFYLSVISEEKGMRKEAVR